VRPRIVLRLSPHRHGRNVEPGCLPVGAVDGGGQRTGDAARGLRPRLAPGARRETAVRGGRRGQSRHSGLSRRLVSLSKQFLRHLGAGAATMSLTAELGEFLATISYDTLPAEAMPIVRTGFTDAVGVMLVGTN